MFLTVAAHAANVRVAVLADPSLQATGLTDQIITHFTPDDGIDLVEREKLSAVVDEKMVQSLATRRDDRARIGSLVAADVLAIMTVDNGKLRLAVCNVKFGIKLHDLQVAVGAKDRDVLLARATADTVRRFRGGVTHIAVVPDLVSKDLTFDRNHLQTDLAEVLRAAYQQLPGVALVAIDEARAIATENALAGGADPARRLAPVFVEGEYRTARSDQAPTVKITLRARDAAGKPLAERQIDVPIDAAGTELLKFFQADLLPLTKAPGVAALDAEGQFKQLIERADAFATFGEWERAAALREAALLLKPDADAQRIRLVQEYTRHTQRPVEKWPAGAKQTEDDPFWKGVVERCIAYWNRSLSHCEYLVRNRRMNREEATRLADGAVFSISGVRGTMARTLGECERVKKDFVREVYSQIPRLRPATREERRGLSGALDAQLFLMKAAIFRCDANAQDKSDLDLIADLLLNRLPADQDPNYNLIYHLEHAAESEQPSGYTEAEYNAFIESLLKSDRKQVQLYGRYARFCQRRFRQKELSPELLAEAKAIAATAKAMVGDDMRFSHYLTIVSNQASFAEMELARRNKPAAGSTRPAVARSETRPARKPPEDPPARLTFEPIEFDLKATLAKETKVAGTRWRGAGGWGGVNRYAALDKGLDALWCHGALLLIRDGKTAVETLAEAMISISDVTADGKYVWAACQYGRGLEVFDYAGKHLATISKNAGLPETSHFGFYIEPLEPGKILAVGTLGNEYRAWVAIVSFDGKTPTVDVILEAYKAVDHADKDKYKNTDPQMGFRPSGILIRDPATAGGKRYAYVLRDTFSPLVVDLAEKKSWVYPYDERQRDFIKYSGNSGSDKQRTQLLELLKNVDPRSGLIPTEQPGDPWRFGRQIRPASLVVDGDWLYHAGDYEWYRVNRKTGQAETVIFSGRQLPANSAWPGWILGNSSQFGLVGFMDGKLYRIRATDAPTK